jgi:hypothetical protein
LRLAESDELSNKGLLLAPCRRSNSCWIIRVPSSPLLRVNNTLSLFARSRPLLGE